MTEKPIIYEIGMRKAKDGDPLCSECNIIKPARGKYPAQCYIGSIEDPEHTTCGERWRPHSTPWSKK